MKKLNDFHKPQMRNECRHEIPNNFDIFSHVKFLLMILKCHLLQKKMAKTFKLFDCRYVEFEIIYYLKLIGKMLNRL